MHIDMCASTTRQPALCARWLSFQSVARVFALAADACPFDRGHRKARKTSST